MTNKIKILIVCIALFLPLLSCSDDGNQQSDDTSFDLFDGNCTDGCWLGGDDD